MGSANRFPFETKLGQSGYITKPKDYLGFLGFTPRQPGVPTFKVTNFFS
jgi:hypothetical protein